MEDFNSSLAQSPDELCWWKFLQNVATAVIKESTRWLFVKLENYLLLDNVQSLAVLSVDIWKRFAGTRRH